MARKSKGFGELLKQTKHSSQSAQSKPISQQTYRSVQEEDVKFASSNMDEQEVRIGKIVGLNEDGEVLDVNAKTLELYRTYLKQNLDLPCQLTGSEDFKWEEYYIIGPGSKKEHSRLRKTQPSYLDTYEFLGFQDDIAVWDGLLISVKRISDKKEFVLPLVDLEATEKQTPNDQLLDDYAVWFANWR